MPPCKYQYNLLILTLCYNTNSGWTCMSLVWFILIWVLFPCCTVPCCRSSFSNQGEICLCTSRVFVQRGIYDKFLERFVKQARCVGLHSPQQFFYEIPSAVGKVDSSGSEAHYTPTPSLPVLQLFLLWIGVCVTFVDWPIKLVFLEFCLVSKPFRYFS